VAAFLLGFLAYVVRTLLFGRVRTDRVMKQGGTALLGEYLMEFGTWIFSPVTSAFIRLRIHPDALSWTSLVLQGISAVALAGGHFGAGGTLLLFGAAFDALDGAVARARGVASDSGEVLDATVDRIGEMAVFFGYAYYYRNDAFGFLLCAAACIGAVMVSYARAKGEGLGIDAKMGLMQRHERAAYLVVATVCSPLVVPFWEPDAANPRHHLVLCAMGVVAVFANVTAIQRTSFIRAELRKRGK
jgi:CDP-diacylglycerol--glycerol-3-phosphate 3-phosphatidyltransferase